MCYCTFFWGYFTKNNLHSSVATLYIPPTFPNGTSVGLKNKQTTKQNKQNKTKWKNKTVLLWAWIRAQLVKGHASMTLTLIPRTPVKKSHAWRCLLRIPVLGRGRQRDPWGSQQTTLLGDLQARDFFDSFQKIRWKVCKDWHLRLVTFGLHTCTHGWAQTHSHIANNTIVFMISFMAFIC